MKLVMNDPTSMNRVGDLTVDAIRDELDEYYEEMRLFPQVNPGEVLMTISSFTARASQIRAHLVRKDNKVLQVFRTKELDPFLVECDRQFKVWSRLISVNQLEWDTSRGQR